MGTTAEGDKTLRWIKRQKRLRIAPFDLRHRRYPVRLQNHMAV